MTAKTTRQITDPDAYPPGSSWRIVTRFASGDSIAYCLACQAHDTLARLRDAGDELVSWGPDGACFERGNSVDLST